MSESECVTISGKASVDGIITSIFPARLQISMDVIKLHAFSGTYYFPKDFLISIEKKSESEIAFRHVITNYPKDITFFNKKAFSIIQSRGYVPSAGRHDSVSVPSNGNFLKKWCWIFTYILWLSAYILPLEEVAQQIYMLLIVAIWITFSVALLFSRQAQLLLLKPERDIRKIRYKVIVIVVFLSLSIPIIILDPYLCERSQYFCKPEVFDW